MQSATPELYSVAIHEAAHFVMITMGYDDIPAGSTPHKLSIVKGEYNDGHMADSALAAFSLPPSYLTERQIARNLLVLLAGYASEIAYDIPGLLTEGDQWGPSGFDIEVCLEVADMSGYTDLTKALEIAKNWVADDKNPEEQAMNVIQHLWPQVVEVLRAPVVRTAIEYVANQLIIQREIEGDAIFDLKSQVFAIPGFAELRLPIPELTRVTWYHDEPEEEEL